MLHAPHAAELDKLGVDAATSQKLLDKGISGPAMIEVAQHGQAAVDLLGEIAIDGRNATNAVEMVKAIAARGKIGEARKASSSLARTGKLRNPHQLAGFLDELQTKEYGDRYSLDLAIEQAAHGDITLDAGKADVVVHRDGRPDLVMQSKYEPGQSALRQGQGRADEGLKHNPNDYSDLTRPQADGTPGWERIEVHTDGKVIVITPGDL